MELLPSACTAHSVQLILKILHTTEMLLSPDYYTVWAKDYMLSGKFW